MSTVERCVNKLRQHRAVATRYDKRQATGVATSALRYWEELGLLAAPARVSGQRRYPPSAVELVGVILLLRDVGFTLRELKALIGPRSPAGNDWRKLHQRKLT